MQQGHTWYQHARKCSKHRQVVSKYSPCCFFLTSAAHAWEKGTWMHRGYFQFQCHFPRRLFSIIYALEMSDTIITGNIGCTRSLWEAANMPSPSQQCEFGASYQFCCWQCSIPIWDAQPLLVGMHSGALSLAFLHSFGSYRTSACHLCATF